MYSDVVAGHLGPDVEDLCWKHGYVYLLHYGGATAVNQVNDTGCHFWLEGTYIELEQRAFAAKQGGEPTARCRRSSMM